MPKNKLEELLNSLTKPEHKQFRLFLMSPFFQCDKVILKLFNILVDSSSLYISDKPLLFKQLYPGLKFSEKLLRYQISDLNKKIEYFLTLKHFEKFPLSLKSYTAKALVKRDCQKAYNLIHSEITSGSNINDANYYIEQFSHAELHLTYTSTKFTRKSLPDFTDTLNNLDYFYIAKKLQLNCEVVNLSNILKKKHEIILSNEIVSFANREPYNNIPVINIYYRILETLLNPDDEIHFVIAEDLLKEHASLFTPGELGDMYQYIKNYCVRKINQGSFDYIRKLYGIYLTMLSNKSLMRYNYLSQWEFKNIVSISLRLNEKKWCREFIERYVNYLNPQERKNALTYNLAYYYFMDEDFKGAIRKLQEVELSDVFYQLDARVILLKCYYELDDYDSFFYHSSAFRLFLLRNRSLSDYQKTINGNLIKSLSAILRAGLSKAKLRKIKSEIEKEKNIADMAWLLKKVNYALNE